MTHRSGQQQALPNDAPEAPPGFAPSRPSRVRFKQLVSSPELTGARVHVPPPPRVPRNLDPGLQAGDSLPPTPTDLPAPKNCGK